MILKENVQELALIGKETDADTLGGDLRIRTLTFNETRLADAATDDVILVA
jgi:hypothetical protein